MVVWLWWFSYYKIKIIVAMVFGGFDMKFFLRQ